MRWISGSTLPEFERLTATLAGRSDTSLSPAPQSSPDLKFDLRFEQATFTAGQVSYDRPMIEPEEGILRLSSYLPTTELEPTATDRAI